MSTKTLSDWEEFIDIFNKFYENYVIHPFTVTIIYGIVLLFIFASFIAVVFSARKLEAAYKTGKKLQANCGNNYMEKETARSLLSDKFNEYKTTISQSLQAIIAALFIIYFYFWIVYIFEAIKAVPATHDWIMKITDRAKADMTSRENRGWWWVLLSLSMFIIISRLGIQLMATVYVVHPFYKIDGPLKDLGVDLKDGKTQNSIYQLTIFIILFGIGLQIYNAPNFANIMLCFAIILVVIMLSFIYNYLDDLYKYTEEYKNKLSIVNNLISNDDLWSNYVAPNIMRVENLKEEPPKDNYTDTRAKYAMHAFGKEEQYLKDKNSTGLLTDQNLTTFKNSMKDLRLVGEKIDVTMEKYMKYIYFFIIFFGGIIGFAVIHILYKTIPSFTYWTLIILFVMLFLTVMYIWMSGEIYG